MVRNQTRQIFQGVTDFFSEMNRLNDAMYGRTPEHAPRNEGAAWTLLTDIHAADDDPVIHCGDPGVDVEDIDISFVGGTLSISGKLVQFYSAVAQSAEMNAVGFHLITSQRPQKVRRAWPRRCHY